jgi:hypothetical protein
MTVESPFDEMRKAVREARAVERAVADQASVLVELLQGHLRDVPGYRLSDLKRELRNFNMHTGRWKE